MLRSFAILSLLVAFVANPYLSAVEEIMAEPMIIQVHADQIVRTEADSFIGINVNFLRDTDANRAPGARPLGQALNELGVRWLRYPGGEKSDYFRFANPPYEVANPSALGWYGEQGGDWLGFDAYIELCRAQGAEPYVVVACEKPENSGPPWAEQLEHAVAWVRYANVVHGYGVRYWEIGNENWHNHTGSPAEMAAHVQEFARAMRAVDPTISIGASGSDRKWWKDFLPRAASDLDFLTVSVYNTWGWKSYARFAEGPMPDLVGAAKIALEAIDALPPGPDRERLRVIVAETNSVDYSPEGWPKTNTLGHALVTFSTFGALLQEPRITGAFLWTTRWIDDAEAAQNQFYALDGMNQVLPSGAAVGLWGRHLHANMLRVTGASGNLAAFASGDSDGAWTIWLVNRAVVGKVAVALVLNGLKWGDKVRAQTWSGRDPQDPSLKVIRDHFLNTPTQVECPPLSITLLTGG